MYIGILHRSSRKGLVVIEAGNGLFHSSVYGANSWIVELGGRTRGRRSAEREVEIGRGVPRKSISLAVCGGLFFFAEV